ncbi:hypothetical protein [Rubripirellula obstinata]|uniref:hypothetical protein n=1 Tax=Rubripirellula obstinata TaxID=406547 RepID=UPI0008375AE1|nr:hypothetical protein [Rubripirellula obstinata]
MRTHPSVSGKGQHDSPVLATGGDDALLNPVSRHEELPVWIPTHCDLLIGERVSGNDFAPHRKVKELSGASNPAAYRVLRQTGLGFIFGHFAGLGF